jgi:hypothetical protein
MACASSAARSWSLLEIVLRIRRIVDPEAEVAPDHGLILTETVGVDPICPALIIGGALG